MNFTKPVSGLLLIGVIGALVLRSPVPSVLPAVAATTPVVTLSEPTDRPAEVYQGSFFDATLPAMLKDLKVTVYPEDKVFAFPDPSLGLGSEIKVYRAQPVLITDADQQKLVRTWAKTVAELATEQHLDLADKDEVTPTRDAAIPLQDEVFQLTVVRVAESELEVSYDIPFDTVTKNDPTLEQGKTKVQTPGQLGAGVKKFNVLRKNGVETQRTLLDDSVKTDPVTEVVLKGTKPKLLDNGQQYQDFINAAALKYGVSATSLYKLMMCESNGHATSVGAGMYKGLYQFTDSSWARSGFGSYDIFDPWAQINATASLWASRYGMWPACSVGLGL